MKKISVNLICALMILVALINHTNACTTFCLVNKSEVLFGRNYDWILGDGLLFVNKRGVQKSATIIDSETGRKWTSKFGSITFNQYGRENPAGGMNEAGLVVELMWLTDTEYPKANATPAVGSQEWIQFILDTAATTDEAIRNAASVRIESEIKIHFLINDKSGNAAIIEFLKGVMVVLKKADLPVPALANSTYADSRAFANHTDSKRATSNTSLDRYFRAQIQTLAFEKKPLGDKQAIDYAFTVLNNLAEGPSTDNPTQWSIVYDQRRQRIYWRTLKSSEIKFLDASQFDYSCSTPVKIFDVDAKEGGDVTQKFSDYTRKANRNLIERAFSGTDLLKQTTPIERMFAASYPESFKCIQ
ncbi:MAG TPA: linear amide C-N hydrolase [Pyrinomonadaceae bacterium]